MLGVNGVYCEVIDVWPECRNNSFPNMTSEICTFFQYREKDREEPSASGHYRHVLLLCGEIH
jgi:hypothetical protein